MKNHNSLIDFYRFVFSVVIVCFHSRYLTYLGYIPFKDGYTVVEFFFILSGFLLSKSAISKDSTEIKEIAFDTVHEVKKRAINMYYYFIPSFVFYFIILNLKEDRFHINLIPSMIKDLGNSVFELLYLPMSGLGKYHYGAVLWYISALFISILIIYPIMRRFKELFFLVIAPILVLFCYGYHFVNYGNISTVYEWNGFFYAGIPRAIGGICLGCICFYVSLLTTKRSNYNGKSYSILSSIVEIVLLLTVLYLMNTYYKEKVDFIIIMLFFVLIYLSFTRDNWLNALFDKKIWHLLGNFSISIYFSHEVFYTSRFPYHPVWKYQFALYILASAILAVINYITANMLMKLFKKVQA